MDQFSIIVTPRKKIELAGDCRFRPVPLPPPDSEAEAELARLTGIVEGGWFVARNRVTLEPGRQVELHVDDATFAWPGAMWAEAFHEPHPASQRFDPRPVLLPARDAPWDEIAPDRPKANTAEALAKAYPRGWRAFLSRKDAVAVGLLIADEPERVRGLVRLEETIAILKADEPARLALPLGERRVSEVGMVGSRLAQASSSLTRVFSEITARHAADERKRLESLAA